MAQDKKLEKALKILELANQDYATTEQVVLAIRSLAGIIQEVKKVAEEATKSSEKVNNSKLLGLSVELHNLGYELNNQLSDNARQVFDTLRGELKKEVEKLKKVINTLPAPFDPTELQNQINVLMEYETPKVEAVEVRDLLETLKDEERLDASAIKNLPEATKTIVEGMNKVMALYMLLDVDVAGIAAGQSIQWDGNKWIAYTPAGSGGTPVWGENLTTQGVGTSFTLAHAPLAGTVRLFRGGSYQSVANGDYSISGATITLTNALQSLEVLVVDYSY